MSRDERSRKKHNNENLIVTSFPLSIISLLLNIDEDNNVYYVSFEKTFYIYAFLCEYNSNHFELLMKKTKNFITVIIMKDEN